MRRLVGLTLLLAVSFLGCGPEKPAEAPTAAPAAPSGAAPAASGTQAPPAGGTQVSASKPAAPAGLASKPATAAVPAVVTPSPVVPPAEPAPELTPKAAPASSAKSPTATPSAVAPAVSGPMLTLASNGHAAIGPDKCRMCHRIQHDSWSASPHAKKGLDCEACHGNGADYRAMAVMKNPTAARAAGLVRPGIDFCRKCHGTKADAALFARVHAHKG